MRKNIVSIKKHVLPVIVAGIIIPMFAFAQSDVFDIMVLVAGWAGGVFGILVGVAVLVIFWNLAMFVLHADDEAQREKYKQFMVWSIIAMFVLVSFWGLVYFFINSAGGVDFGTPDFIDSGGNVVA